MNPIRVLLADDHTLFRAGTRGLLQGLSGVEVVAEAANGREALVLLREHQPDVVLIDIMMPELNGLIVAARASQECPQARVLILSMHAGEECVRQALQAGAAGYLVKDAEPCELELAVRAAARGETYLSPSVSRHLVADYLQPQQGPRNCLALLTPRQREILQLVAEGRTSKEIARALQISARTVENHRRQLMGRLDIHDMGGLVRFAIRVGLVSPPS